MRDHLILTSLEDGWPKLDFGGKMSFLKMPPEDARKLGQKLIDLADAAEDPTMRVAHEANSAIGQPGSVGMAVGEEDGRLIVKFTERVGRLNLMRAEAEVLIAALQHYLPKTR